MHDRFYVSRMLLFSSSFLPCVHLFDAARHCHPGAHVFFWGGGGGDLSSYSYLPKEREDYLYLAQKVSFFLFKDLCLSARACYLFHVLRSCCFVYSGCIIFLDYLSSNASSRRDLIFHNFGALESVYRRF